MLGESWYVISWRGWLKRLCMAMCYDPLMNMQLHPLIALWFFLDSWSVFTVFRWSAPIPKKLPVATYHMAGGISNYIILYPVWCPHISMVFHIFRYVWISRNTSPTPSRGHFEGRYSEWHCNARYARSFSSMSVSGLLYRNTFEPWHPKYLQKSYYISILTPNISIKNISQTQY